MSDAKLEQAVNDTYREIKKALLEKRISQKQLAGLLGEGEAQVSRAIRGDMNPQSREIRRKIYEFLER